MTTADDMAQLFRLAADDHRARAPFQSALCDTIGGHPDAAELLLAAPPEQRLPALMTSVIHHLLLTEPDDPLAAWYPSIAPDARTDDVADALVDHIDRHRDRIVAALRHRSLQTNDVGRSGFLVAGVAAAVPDGPVALVDVGCSAGLNLRLDRYGYHYRPGGTIGIPAALELVVGTRGPVPVPAARPRVSARIGIDRAPVALDDPDGLRWLRACIWPDQLDRRRRFDAALAIAADHPAELRRGDAVDDLGAAVDDAARAGHPVVMHSWVLNYLPPARRRAFVAELERLGRRTDLSWVFAEAPALGPELPHAPVLAGSHLTALTVVTWRSGDRDVRHLGTTHPHGYWWHALDH